MTRTGPRGVVLLTLVICGCGAQSTARGPAHAAEPAPVTMVRVPRTIVTPTDATSISSLYAQAQEHFDAERWTEAARAFDRVYELDSDGELAPDALFQAGHAHDEAAEHQSALKRYVLFSRRFPENRMHRTALVRQVRLLTHLEDWTRAGQVSDVLLADEDAGGPFDRIVAYSGKSLALLDAGNDERAEYYLAKARNVVDQHQLDSAGKLPRDLARLFFALGELRRIRAERLNFDPLPDDFGVYLEARCQLLLDAQSAYSNAMRAYDAHWSAMAGYRVGELYHSLHKDLMRVPAPASAGTRYRRDLFEGAMRLRYAILLSKAESMMEHTLRMAERTGESSAWTERARQARDQIARDARAEHAAIDRLPFSRAELQAALDHLQAKYASH